MSALKTVLVGFGKIADTMRHDARMARFFPDSSHAQILARHDAFDWIAVVDPSAEALERAAGEWNVGACVAEIADLQGRETIEAAVIATPPQHRCAILDELPGLRAVLVEKPLGGTVDEARAFVEECSRRSIAVQVNYWRRAVPVFQALASGGLEEEVGDVQAVFGLYGNGLLNNGSHLVDFLRMLCGEIEGIDGCGRADNAKQSSVPGDIQTACLLRLANGAHASLMPADFKAWREVGLDIWGTKGRLSILQEGLTVARYRVVENRGLENEMEIDSGSVNVRDVDVGHCLEGMYDSLAGDLFGTSALLSPAGEALASESIVHEIAARSRKTD